MPAGLYLFGNDILLSQKLDLCGLIALIHHFQVNPRIPLLRDIPHLSIHQALICSIGIKTNSCCRIPLQAQHIARLFHSIKDSFKGIVRLRLSFYVSL